MKIAVFLIGGDLSGGNYRELRTLSLFPKEKFELMIPEDRFLSLKEEIEKVVNNRVKNDLFNLLEKAVRLKPLGINPNITSIIKYSQYVAKIATHYGAEALYFPYGNLYYHLGLSYTKIEKFGLLQLTPVVGSLVNEDGTGYKLLRNNMKLLFNANDFEVLKGYLKLNLFKYSVRNTNLLSVSTSIIYELNKLGIKVKAKPVMPGVGVDECHFDLQKEFDIAFFSRVIPLKGIYDFIEALKIITKKLQRAKVAIIGFSSKEMEEVVRTKAKEITENVSFFFNSKRDEAMKALAKTKLLLYPSKHDSFSLSLLESLSCGTPAVAYNIPAIRFNFNTDAVEKVPPLNINELAKRALDILNTGVWVEMGKKGFEFSKNFSWEKVVESETKLLSI
jgi:glycosyltransferase involved in cell wall biosynthesis